MGCSLFSNYHFQMGVTVMGFAEDFGLYLKMRLLRYCCLIIDDEGHSSVFRFYNSLLKNVFYAAYGRQIMSFFLSPEGHSSKNRVISRTF